MATYFNHKYFDLPSPHEYCDDCGCIMYEGEPVYDRDTHFHVYICEKCANRLFEDEEGYTPFDHYVGEVTSFLDDDEMDEAEQFYVDHAIDELKEQWADLLR